MIVAAARTQDVDHRKLGEIRDALEPPRLPRSAVGFIAAATCVQACGTLGLIAQCHTAHGRTFSI